MNLLRDDYDAGNECEQTETAGWMYIESQYPNSIAPGAVYTAEAPSWNLWRKERGTTVKLVEEGASHHREVIEGGAKGVVWLLYKVVAIK
jgi:hypothetical protein